MYRKEEEEGHKMTKKRWKGSFTAEAAVVISMVFLVLGTFILSIFIVHDKAVFQGLICETAVAGSNFAAKEAVSKALGTGFRGFGLLDIEVLRDDKGKPIVILSDRIYEMLPLNNFNIHISISHSRENAIAYAVMEVIE